MMKTPTAKSYKTEGKTEAETKIGRNGKKNAQEEGKEEEEEGPLSVAACAAAVGEEALVNQETETVAMVDHSRVVGMTTIKTMEMQMNVKPTNTTTTRKQRSYHSNAGAATIKSVLQQERAQEATEMMPPPQTLAPAPTPGLALASAPSLAPLLSINHPTDRGVDTSSPSSVKRKPTKRAKKERNQLDGTDGGNAAARGGDDGGDDVKRQSDLTTVAVPTTATTAKIKTSLSMTSLPPDEKDESRDVIKAKLRVERPYNSLKKNSERSLVSHNFGTLAHSGGNSSPANNLSTSHSSGKCNCHSHSHVYGQSLVNCSGGRSSTKSQSQSHCHRYSWGSSSSSLYSNQTLGLGSSKDDFWAGIRTNYDYIMDTNLIETCKEARCEIEGAANVMEFPLDCQCKLLGENQRRDGYVRDPNEVRKWLHEMESKLDNAPTAKRATKFSIAELEQYLAEHSALYHEIASYFRVISACVRLAAEKKYQQQQQQVEDHQQNIDSAEQNNLSLSSIDEPSTSTATGSATEVESAEIGTAHVTVKVEGTAFNIPTTRSGTGSGSSSSSSGIAIGECVKTPTTSSTSQPYVEVAAAEVAGIGTALTTSSERSEEALEDLKNRYHLVYLKALEVQLWLDGLLRKKSSSVKNLNDYDDEEDIAAFDNDDATEDDLNDGSSDLDSDITRNSSSIGDLQHPSHTDGENCSNAQVRRCSPAKVDCEDGDDEEEEEGEENKGEGGREGNVDEVDFVHRNRVWPNFGYTAVLVTYDRCGKVGGSVSTTLTDFEADSESSDSEDAVPLRRLRDSRFKGNTKFGQQKLQPHLQFKRQQHQKQQQQHQLQQRKVVTSTPNCSINLASREEAEGNKGSTALLTNRLTSLSLPTLSSSVNLPSSGRFGSHVAAAHTIGAVTMDTTCFGQREDSLAATAIVGALGAPDHQQQLPQQQQDNAFHQVNCLVNGTTMVLSTVSAPKIPTPTPTRPQSAQKLQALHSHCSNTPTRQKSVAVISPNNHNNNNNTTGNGSNKSPVLRKQQRHVDVSKFNRSNRKSKNCAIFYFKHLDTDNETSCSGTAGGNDAGTGNISSSASQESDLVRCVDASSDDDEGWLYSTTAVEASNLDCLRSSNENHSNSIGIGIGNSISTLVVDGLQSSAVSSSTAGTSIALNRTVIGDDSDKENKETITDVQLGSATVLASTVMHGSSGGGVVGGCNSTSSSYRNSSSSCSSNDLLTEATTSTHTATTQITQMHFHRGDRQETELQSNGGNTNNGNNRAVHYIVQATECKSNFNSNSSSIKNNNNDIQGAEMMKQQLQHTSYDANGNPQQDKLCCTQQHSHLNPVRSLPPRSPAKSGKSHKPHGSGDGANTNNNKQDNLAIKSPAKGKVSHESIKQLVLEAEHLVRDEALKTPTKSRHSITKICSTVKKRDTAMPGPIKQRVQEWLEHQPSTPGHLLKTHDTLNTSFTGSLSRGDDCEASGEASESDSIPQPGSDTSEGFTDSIATCMQTSTNSYGGHSTDRLGGSAEPIIGPAATHGYGSSNQSLNVKITKRQQTRRKSERPWSVSCLSQLSTDAVQVTAGAAAVKDVQAGLASHSISESALDSLTPNRPRGTSSSSNTQVAQAQACDSKASLKRRKIRKKKFTSANSSTNNTIRKTTDSGLEEATPRSKLSQTHLLKSCESISTQQIQEITAALLKLQRTSSSAEQLTVAAGHDDNGKGNGDGHSLGHGNGNEKSPPKLSGHGNQQQPLVQNESGEEAADLMKPNFRVGSYTTAYMRNEKRLGSLAALATYMHDDAEQQGEYTTGTEDHHSSFSETAWDNYQEKYNSENYSEGLDSDAARRLMEFGDDYRNFIDSQSDCCSSLSAANNVDSLSPPRMDSLQQNEAKMISQDTIVSSVDHARRRRALELEYERRRKTLEVRRKSCQDAVESQNTRSPTISLSSSANALTPKNGNGISEKFSAVLKGDSTSRKLDFGAMSHSAQSLRRTSESDTSIRRRKVDERRRSSRNLEKCIKHIPATSSSSGDESDDEKEIRNLLQQNRNRLDDTRALKIRCHLLRPEDYTEIINTCRDNIRCLEAVLRGPPGTVMSSQCANQTKDLLAAWEDLLGWCENAASARKLQEEMIVLKHALHRLGNKSSFELLETEPAIQVAIEALKNEKSQLQNYRTNMLRLNASVHSWLTRQERKLQATLAEQQLQEASAGVRAELAQTEQEETESEQIEKHVRQTKEREGEGEGENVGEDATAIDLMSEIATSKVDSPLDSGIAKATAASPTGTVSATTNTKETTSTAVGTNDKPWDMQTLVKSENEFHKHLKDEVSDMYSAWDDADARINSQLDILTNSLIAWRQLEYGLYEFQMALGHDRGTLKGLEGALDRGQASPMELAQNVKLVAKLLSERVHVSQEQLTAVQEHLDPNHVLHIAKFTSSNGSLSDSGISDGGTTSDGGLSERERRLGVLRRLVKQLESALAPGSDAMKSIAARMESAEAELKNLQNTCRDLIVRTAASHQNKKQQQLEAQLRKGAAIDTAKTTAYRAKDNEYFKANGHAAGKTARLVDQLHQQHNHPPEGKSPSKRKNKRRNMKNSSNSKTEGDVDVGTNTVAARGSTLISSQGKPSLQVATAPDSGDPSDDPPLEFDLNSDDDMKKRPKNGWAWRIARAAVPVQLALFTVFCAACLMQPNCCDNINNLAMSFTPQLRYIRGPPPI